MGIKRPSESEVPTKLTSGFLSVRAEDMLSDGLLLHGLYCFQEVRSDGLVFFRQFFGCVLHHIGRKFVQAVGVAERAFAFETGRALKV